MRVLIAGGGIGGLTTAIALRHQGIDAKGNEHPHVARQITCAIAQRGRRREMPVGCSTNQRSKQEAAKKDTAYDYPAARTRRLAAATDQARQDDL